MLRFSSATLEEASRRAPLKQQNTQLQLLYYFICLFTCCSPEPPINRCVIFQHERNRKHQPVYLTGSRRERRDCCTSPSPQAARRFWPLLMLPRRREMHEVFDGASGSSADMPSFTRRSEEAHRGLASHMQLPEQHQHQDAAVVEAPPRLPKEKSRERTGRREAQR